MSADENIHSWGPISRNEIRLLQVLATEPYVKAELSPYPFDKPPEYYAISYACGSQKATEWIECERKRISITPHLQAGIRSIVQLRGYAKLWIDAVCINQENDKEKAQQVANMHHIYRNAAEVIVWLGVASDDSDLACRYIKSCTTVFPELLRLNLSATGISEYLAEIQPLKMKDSMTIRPWNRNLDLRTFRAIWAFNMRPWFFRLWTVQEIALAKKFQFFCGMEEVEGILLIHVGFKLMTASMALFARSYLGISHQETTEAGFDQFIAVLNAAPNGTSNLFSKFSLAVFNSRSRVVTEPVDRVYSLLGLDANLGLNYASLIPVNYSCEAKRRYINTYMDFGKAALRIEPMLFLLHMTSSQVRPDGLPSWCPNLGSRMETNPFGLLYEAGWPTTHHADADSSKLRCLAAHPKSCVRGQTSVHTFPHSPNIQVWGTVADVIEAIGPPYALGDPNSTMSVESVHNASEAILRWIDESWEFCQGITTLQVDQLSETFQRTLVGDLNSSRSTFPCTTERLDATKFYVRYLHLLQEQHNRVGTYSADSLTSEEKNFYASRPDWQALIQNYTRNLGVTWHNRVFFRTSAGRVGFTVKSALPGDRVCVLYGGPSVYILHPIGDSETFQFVDVGYTHGLMKGEAFGLLDDGLIQERMFVIS